MKTSLAIVIPAYKSTFLCKTLGSLTSQTDKRFNVYIGDDHSPNDLSAICQPFSQKLNLNFVRFEENIGGQSVVEQWNRCVLLSNEPWVWLLCDDDEIDANCVEMFYQFLNVNDEKINLVRFDTQVIDENSQVLRDNAPHPERESSINFVLNRMKSKRSSYVSEYIFKRTVFDKYKGFVDFPSAWASDDASWVQFTEELPIAKINGARVQWRTSELNISAVNSPHSFAKIDASLQYIQWLIANIFVPEKSTVMQQEELLIVSKIWLFNLIWKLSPYFDSRQRQKIINQANDIFDNKREIQIALWKSNVRFRLRKCRK